MSEHYKPADWSRPGFWADNAAFKEVVEDNVYKLPQDMAGWRCVDVGGHVGSFCYAALERNAADIYTFEADPRNYERLVSNVRQHPLCSRVDARHGAVWRSDQPGGLLGMAAFADNDPSANTGGGSVARADSADFHVPAVPFVSIVDKVGEIDFLKLDCEGAEFPILFTLPQDRLAKIKRIGAELHPFQFWRREAVVFGHFRGDVIQALVRFLDANNFDVRVEEQHLHNRPLMFAKRRDVA